MICGAEWLFEPSGAIFADRQQAIHQSGHPARLNFGDCFAYALARAAGEPLLFKGNPFMPTS